MNGSHRPEGLWVLAGRGVDPTVATEAAIVDVAPSVLHLAGLDVPSWMDGRLLPGIVGTPRIAEDPLALTDARDDQDHEAELRRRLRALGYLSEPAA
jgi:hypothetical protein